MISKNRLSISKNQIYYFTVVLVALQDSLNSSALFNSLYVAIKLIFTLLIVTLCLYQLLFTKYPAKKLLFLGVCVVLGVNTSIKLETNSVLYIVLLSYLSIGKDMKKVAKIVLGVVGTVFIIHLLTFVVTYLVMPGTLSVMYSQGMERYYLYYDHPNNAAKTCLFLIVLYCYLTYQKLKIRHWLIFVGLVSLVAYFTKSDAIYVSVDVFILWLINRAKIGKKVVDFVTKYGMIIFAGASAIFASLSYVPVINRLIAGLDFYANGRFVGFYRAVEMYGITLFGQYAKFGASFTLEGKEYGWIYADNLTIYCITCLGLIYIILLCFILYKNSEKLNYVEKVVIIVFLLFALFENRIFTIEVYFSIMLITSKFTSKLNNVIIE